MAKTATQRAPHAGGTHTAEGIPLKDPLLAAVLAWLLPGLGHWYQGRRSKAVLFFVCIMGTFIYGLYLGEGRVVYASMRPQDRRLYYFCQVGVGLPALPALVQAHRVRNNQPPLNFPVWDRFMVPPSMVKRGDAPDPRDRPTELDQLHKRLHRYFELGTIFTAIAGLLNLLVIYDAWAGPAEIDPPLGRKEDEDEGQPRSPPPPGSGGGGGSPAKT